MDELWTQTLNHVREQVSGQVFEAWIKPLRPAGPLKNGKLVLLTVNDFTTDWVQSRYLSLLQQALSEAAGRAVTLSFQVDPEPRAESPEPVRAPPPSRREGAPPEESNLDSRYTFDSFVVGACNQFVHAAAERVAEAPATSYNPLFIYGGTGLGKTHIMQAIGHHVRQSRPDARVLYTSSEKFMTQLINALRFKRVMEFKEGFRSLDVLMVDDIQFLAGKERTQEEFFHTFNALFEANKQIVITSDRFPNEIEHLEERLRSRFGWGLVADIQAPDLETRIAILKKKSVQDGVDLPDDVAFFLANAITTNVRELEGALIRVTAFASLTRRPIDMGLVKETLRDIVKGQERVITVEQIIKTVSAYYKIRPADIRSDKRTRLFSHPRQIAMYLCKQLTNHSYPEVGHQFGGRDHTTVLYAVRRVEQQRAEDGNLSEELDSLTAMLQK